MPEEKKALLEQIIETTTAKSPSDESADPPRIALVEFKRESLIKVLKPNAETNKRAATLLAGVTAAGKGKDVVIQREHLLIALGQMEDEDGDGDDSDADV